VAALQPAALQPANQHAKPAKLSYSAFAASVFPESCPGFEKRLKGERRRAVVLRIAAMNELNEPLRLLRKRGHWTLEVTKLVAIDQHVLRPERRRVNGTDSVVRHLKERCAPSLVRQALDLLIGDDDGTDRAFELEGEHWVQLQEEVQETRVSSNADLVALIGELRVELTTMRALHEAMRGRLAVLERRSLQTGSNDHNRAALRGSSRRDLPGASLRPSARARSLHPQDDAESLAPAARNAPPGPSGHLGEARTQAAVAPPPTVAVVAPAPAPAKPALLMPSPLDIATCLKQLLGADPELRPEKGNLPKDLDAFYVSRIVDTGDQEVGAILFDLRGGVELGGRLLGFPASAIEEQAKSEPSADILDGMNEVTNNLGGFVNRANPDLRVRVRPLEKFTSAEFGWLPQNTARVGSATKTGGRLWIAAR
jgi:hypothetical protein